MEIIFYKQVYSGKYFTHTPSGSDLFFQRFQIQQANIQTGKSRQTPEDPKAYVTMLLRAHEFSSTIVGDDMDAMQKHLEESNAFKEYTKAKLKIVHGEEL